MAGLCDARLRQAIRAYLDVTLDADTSRMYFLPTIIAESCNKGNSPLGGFRRIVGACQDIRCHHRHCHTWRISPFTRPMHTGMHSSG